MSTTHHRASSQHPPPPPPSPRLSSEGFCALSLYAPARPPQTPAAPQTPPSAIPIRSTRVKRLRFSIAGISARI
eukprot:3932722-Rhodomonas_salina.2